MAPEPDLVGHLDALNGIPETLNRAADVGGRLKIALARPLDLMGLEAGWIFTIDPSAQGRWAGRGFTLAAQDGLPPATAPDRPEAWEGSCEGQGLCTDGQPTGPYTEVHCSRIAAAVGDRRGLAAHASAPLRSAEQIVGMLNVAARDISGDFYDFFYLPGSPLRLGVVIAGSAPLFDGVTMVAVRREPVSQEQAISHDWGQYRLRPEGMPAAQRRKAI